MTTKQNPCSSLTRRGEPCQNQALAHTDPPACRVHRVAAPRLPLLKEDPDQPQPVIFLTEGNDTRSLAAELQLVRHTLHLLATYLDNAKCALEPRELRQLAQVIFSGARTAAALLLQEGRKGNGLETWFTEALDQLAREYDLEL